MLKRFKKFLRGLFYKEVFVAVETVETSDSVSTHWAADQEEITLQFADSISMTDSFGDGPRPRFTCDQCGLQFDASLPTGGREFQDHLMIDHSGRVM